MKHHFFLLASAFLILGSFMTSCSKDEAVTKTQPQEFVATDEDFANFRTWEMIGSPLRGPDPAGMLGDAHGAMDSALTRTVYGKPTGITRTTTGEFPVGTILVKELRMPDGTVPMVTVMAKRGGDFNKDNKSWEWFMTDKDGKIMDRGAGFMNNMCNACHSAQASKDYVFTK